MLNMSETQKELLINILQENGLYEDVEYLKNKNFTSNYTYEDLKFLQDKVLLSINYLTKKQAETINKLKLAFLN